jgi:hypothetical protein
MVSSSIHSVRIFSALLLIVASYAFFVPSLTIHIAQVRRKSVAQQNLAAAPPFPILQVGWEHIMGQIGANAITPEDETNAEKNLQVSQSLKGTPLQARHTSAQCGPGIPCSDGSCCNSVSASLSEAEPSGN